MGPILDFDSKRIMTEPDLERALLEYTPKLFFDFHFDTENHELIIEVPKQIIEKVEKYLVPQIGFTMFVKVVERGKNITFSEKFLSWFDNFSR